MKSLSLLFSLALVSPALAADRVDIALDRSDNGVLISVASDRTSSYAQVLNPLHSDHGRFLSIESGLSDLGYKFDGSASLYESKISVYPSQGEAIRVLNPQSPLYGFLQRLDGLSGAVKQTAQAKGPKAFSLEGKLAEKAILVSSKTGSFGPDVGVTLGGRLVYCLIPVLEDVKVPNFLQRIIDINCAQERNLDVIQRDLPNLAFSFSEKSARETLPLPKELPQQGLIFSSLANSVCPNSSITAGTAAMQADYQQAGWISKTDETDPELIARECGYFIYTEILPKLKAGIEKAVANPGKSSNLFANTFLEAISTTQVSSVDVQEQNVEDLVLGLVGSDLSSVNEKYNRTYDLDLPTFTRLLQNQVVTKDQFQTIVAEFFKAKKAGPQTPYIKGILALSNDQQDQAVEDLAKALTLECGSEVPVTINCVRDSRSRLNKYEIKVKKLDGSIETLYGLGGVRMKEVD